MHHSTFRSLMSVLDQSRHSDQCPLYPRKRTSIEALFSRSERWPGSLAMFAAIRRASSLMSSLAADLRPDCDFLDYLGSFLFSASKID